MRKWMSVLALLALTVMLVVPAFAQERLDIVETLAEDGRFSTLVAAVEAAGLTDTLSTGGPFTVLAPTDEAFAAALDALGVSAEDALANTELLATVLQYHILPNRILSSTLSFGTTQQTLLEGQSLRFVGRGRQVQINGEVNIIDDNISASNGVIHVVDAVLLPSGLEAAAPEAEAEAEAEPTPAVGVAAARLPLSATLANDEDSRFSTLLLALVRAGLMDDINTATDVTILAPTNEAFAAALETLGLTQDELFADSDVLSQILLFHVLTERTRASDLYIGGTFTTLQGEDVTFANEGGFLTANGVVVGPDIGIIARNGVIHVIEGDILLPPSLAEALQPAATEETDATPEATPVAGVAATRPGLLETLANDADGRFTTLVAAIEAAGLADSLSDGEFTILAPTNDAIAAAVETLGLTPEALLADPDQLSQILLFHIIPQRTRASDLYIGGTFTTLQGEDVTFANEGGFLTANGVVVGPDIGIIADNGVAHVIEDGILLPPSLAAALQPADTTEPEAPPTAGVAATRPGLLETLANDADGRFTTLVAAIEAAGLADSLSDGEFTILAPTNDAIAAAVETLGLTPEALLADPDQLSQILLFHIIPQRTRASDLYIGGTFTTLQGEDVTFANEGGFLTANGVVVGPDIGIIADNGVAHVIEDGILLPPSLAAALQPADTTEPEAPPVAGVAATRPGLLETLANDADGRFTTLVAAIEAAGLADSLSDGEFTILAPTNDAIAAAVETLGLTPETLLANPDQLSQILLFHIIPQRTRASDLYIGGTFTTLQGEDVTFANEGGFLTANGVVVGPDIGIIADNGVAHVIEDGILLPPSLAAALQPADTTEPEAPPTAGVAVTRPSLLETLTNDPDGRFTTLLAAIDAAGLSEVVANQNDLTILAPTNDAFTAALDLIGVSADDLLADPAELTDILLLHVIPQRTRTSTLFVGETLSSLQGEDVVFATNELGQLTANGALVGPDANIIAQNGVVHVLNGVLLPTSVQEQIEASRGRVRFGHFSLDAGAVDVYINGELSDLQGVEFTTISDWLPFREGSYEIGIAPAGGDTILTTTAEVGAGEWTTVALTGTTENNSLALQFIDETYNAIGAGSARLTVFHTVEGAGSVDIRLNGGIVVAVLGYPGTLGNNDGVYTLPVQAGTYLVTVTPTGVSQPVLLRVDGVTLEAGTNYFLALVGTPDTIQHVLSATVPAEVVGQ
jgi:transforming growth factor-beta-induced protein